MKLPAHSPGAPSAWAWVLSPPWRYTPIGMPIAVIVVSLMAGLLPRPLGGVLILLSMLGLWALLFFLASRLLLLRAAGVPLVRQADQVETPPGVATRHVLLWLMASALLALVYGGAGLAGGILACLALALILPAATLVLTSGRSLSDALYPPEWLQFVRQLGWTDYLSLSVWLTVYALLYLLVAAALADLPVWLRNAVQMAWWSAAVLAWFAQAGMLLHAHRNRRREKPRSAPRSSETNPEALFDRVMREGGNAETHRKLARMLESARLDRRALAHSQIHICALLQTFERPLEALEQADRMLAIDPEFSLNDPTDMRRLIDTARDLGPPDLALSLCRNYLRRFRASVFTDEIRLSACEALAADGLLDSEEGRAWLDALKMADLDPGQQQRLARLDARQAVTSGRPGG